MGRISENELTSGNGVFERDFMMTIRETNSTSSPLTPEEIIELGLEKGENSTRRSRKICEAEIMIDVATNLRKTVSGETSIGEMVDSLRAYIRNEQYGSPKLCTVYKCTLRAISEKELNGEERKKLAEVIRMSLVSNDEKAGFSKGVNLFRNYVKMAKTYDLYPDNWNLVFEVLMNVIHVDVVLADDIEMKKYNMLVQLTRRWTNEQRVSNGNTHASNPDKVDEEVTEKGKTAKSAESIEPMALPSSKDAWKPDRQKAGDSIPEDEAAIKEVCKKVRTLMNKVTPTSQVPLTQEFISYNVSSNDKQLEMVVGIVFDKAVEEPKFCALYAEICKAQVNHEMAHTGNNYRSLFRNALLRKTQRFFQDKRELDEKGAAIIAKEEDPVKKAALEVEEKQKFKRRKVGVATFIGDLCRNGLLSNEIVKHCSLVLFASVKDLPLKKENIDEESVHCGLQLIETAGMMLDKSKDAFSMFLDQWFGKLNDAKPLCSNKIRFMIMNLVELRKNKWIPRKSTESGGEGSVRPNSNSLRKQPPVSRNSLERNRTQHPDQKRAAAAANTKLQSSNVTPKNVSLSAMDNNSNYISSGKIKKEWNSGASRGGYTSEAARAGIMRTVKIDIGEVVAGDLPLKDFVESFSEFIGKEKYGKPSLVVVYEMMVRAVSEKDMKEEERKKLAHAFRMSLVSKTEKQAFIDGVTRFCKYAVDFEMFQDDPNLWSVTAEVLMKTMHVHHEVIEGQTPVENISLNEMGPAFLAAKTEGKKKYELFVKLMKLMTDEDLAETNSVDALAWGFQELSFKDQMMEEGLREEMGKVEASNGSTLAELLFE